jgi:hypothetical protein
MVGHVDHDKAITYVNPTGNHPQKSWFPPACDSLAGSREFVASWQIRGGYASIRSQKREVTPMGLIVDTNHQHVLCLSKVSKPGSPKVANYSVLCIVTCNLYLVLHTGTFFQAVKE